VVGLRRSVGGGAERIHRCVNEPGERDSAVDAEISEGQRFSRRYQGRGALKCRVPSPTTIASHPRRGFFNSASNRVPSVRRSRGTDR